MLPRVAVEQPDEQGELPVLPMSRSQIKKLGKRLRESQTPANDDLDLLQTLLAAYDIALDIATARIRDHLGVSPGPRLKNTGTIIEKLRRSPNGQLDNIQDLAGLRIVLDRNDLPEQDELVASIRRLFPSNDDAFPKLYDRRTFPSWGYGAVHVVVKVGDIPVEVQIRTPLQQAWAEYYEKLGDRFGREIRYGEPINTDRFVAALDDEEVRDKTRSAITESCERQIDLANRLADLIANREDLSRLSSLSDERMRSIASICVEVETEIADLLRQMANNLDTFFTSLDEVLS